MLDTIKNNKALVILLAIVIAFFVWFGMSEKAPTTNDLLTAEGGAESSAAEQELLKLLLDMRSIRLDGTLFEKPAFNSLHDFGKEIMQEPVGRTNPFETIGTDILELATGTPEFELTENIPGAGVDIESF
jgi:hypothetical protein